MSVSVAHVPGVFICYCKIKLNIVFCDQAEFPSTVGVVEDVVDTPMQTDDTNSSQPEKQKSYHFDTVNIKVPRKGKEMVTFLKEGMGASVWELVGQPFWVIELHTLFTYWCKNNGLVPNNNIRRQTCSQTLMLCIYILSHTDAFQTNILI